MRTNLTSPARAQPTSTEPVSAPVPTDERTVRAALEGYVRLSELWSLPDREAAPLLDLQMRTWQRLKKDRWSNPRLTRDQLLRVGLLGGIYRGLPQCFGPDIALAWPRLSNSSAPFDGRSPVQYMIEEALPAFLAVCQRVASME